MLHHWLFLYIFHTTSYSEMVGTTGILLLFWLVFLFEGYVFTNPGLYVVVRLLYFTFQDYYKKLSLISASFNCYSFSYLFSRAISWLPKVENWSWPLVAVVFLRFYFSKFLEEIGCWLILLSNLRVKRIVFDIFFTYLRYGSWSWL